RGFTEFSQRQCGCCGAANSGSAVWFCLVGVLAQVADEALGALGLARYADVAPMQDEPVMGVEPIGLWHPPQQGLFDFQNVAAGCDAGAVGYSENMRIHG